MKTALVTGANSGVGFETAFQLKTAGYGQVILGCRTLEKATAAREELVARGAPDVFESLALDTSEAASGARATDELLRRGAKIDLLILNAGAAGGGNEMIFASTLIGHHALTTALLKGDGIADHGRIIIAGSEAARGDVMGMRIPDLDAPAPKKHDAKTAYAMAKLHAAWWAAEMATRVPKTVGVYAVSPGNTPSTRMARDLPWPVRNILFPVLAAIGPFIGMAHSVRVAGRRYLDASEFDIRDSGKFFASPAKKLTGAMVEQHTKWLDDAEKRAAGYQRIVALSES